MFLLLYHVIKIIICALPITKFSDISVLFPIHAACFLFFSSHYRLCYLIFLMFFLPNTRHIFFLSPMYNAWFFVFFRYMLCYLLFFPPNTRCVVDPQQAIGHQTTIASHSDKIIIVTFFLSFLKS